MQLDDADGALDSWARFCALSGQLVGGAGDLSVGPRLAPVVADLCARGLATLVRDYFLHNLEVRNSCSSLHTYFSLRCYFLVARVGNLGQESRCVLGVCENACAELQRPYCGSTGPRSNGPHAYLWKCPSENLGWCLHCVSGTTSLSHLMFLYKYENGVCCT
jgi:anaphase-promoting complex subunit 2